MKYYQILRNLREDNDLTQKDISKTYYLGKNTYYNYENGNREIPFSLVVKLAKMYKVSLDYIAGLTSDKGGLHTNNSEESYILSLYNSLSEKKKGKAELYLEQLVRQQNKENQTTIKGNGNISVGDINQSNSTNANINIGNNK